MATATPRRGALALAVAAAAVAVAGCGGAARPQSHAFAWLKSSATPAGWKTGRIPSGQATVAYPAGWRPIRTDPGTFSAALLGPRGRIRGYLNATPQSGEETLANWARFRPAHNAEEGDRGVVREASAAGLRFGSGTGSCVIDHYTTTASTRYREIACIVRGAHATTVVVGAAPPADWRMLGPQLERSIASFAT